MNRWNWVLTLLLIGSAGACKPAPRPAEDAAAEQPPTDTEHADILHQIRRYYADLSARDWDAFQAHFWPNATLTTIWQPPGADTIQVFVSSVPGFVAEAPNGPGSQPIFEETMTEAEIRAQGPLAQVWARYEARFGTPDSLMEWSGIDAFTLMRHEGAWKIVALAYAAE